jgi:hypothetical protein
LLLLVKFRAPPPPPAPTQLYIKLGTVYNLLIVWGNLYSCFFAA